MVRRISETKYGKQNVGKVARWESLDSSQRHADMFYPTDKENNEYVVRELKK